MKNQNKTFIIAEMSANHNQDFDLAAETIRAMARSGADAVKLQTYTPDTITLNSDKSYFQITQGTIWDGSTLYDLYKSAYTPWEWHRPLQRIAHDEGLVFFSTPFDFTAVDFLEEMDVPMYKVASFEIHDLPLIQYIAEKGKPIIFSTGIATYDDVENAVCCIRGVDENIPITVLKCTSAYPTLPREVNLLGMSSLARDFGVNVGISDHTSGIMVPIMGVALGATVVEKHFILDKSISTPDSSFSLDEHGFFEMVAAVRSAEEILGDGSYDLTKRQMASREHGRSLFVCDDVRAGDAITMDNVRSVRPAVGMSPSFLYQVLEKRFNQDVEYGEPLSWDMVE